MKNRWKPAEHDEVLRRLWQDGVLLKVICARMGFCDTTVSEHRRLLGLQGRWRNSLYQRGKCVSVYLDLSLFLTMNRLACKKKAKPAEYIRGLIRYDLERTENGTRT